MKGYDIDEGLDGARQGYSTAGKTTDRRGDAEV
jgi:hypothetical protein